MSSSTSTPADSTANVVGTSGARRLSCIPNRPIVKLRTNAARVPKMNNAVLAAARRRRRTGAD